MITAIDLLALGVGSGGQQLLRLFPSSSKLKSLTLRSSLLKGGSSFPGAVLTSGDSDETRSIRLWFTSACSSRNLKDVECLTLVNLDLGPRDLLAATATCEALTQLVIRGGRCVGPVFFGAGHGLLIAAAARNSRGGSCGLIALELTGCLSQDREQLGSLSCLTSLRKLRITFAKETPVQLRDVTPVLAKLPLLVDLCVSGLDM